MIWIVSDKISYSKSLTHVLEVYGFRNISSSTPSLDEILPRLNNSAIVIIDVHLNDRTSGLTLARKLRCNRELKFKGKIIILSFEPLERLKTWPDGEVLETEGFALLTMPFRISELKELVDSVHVLSEEEWERISRRLRLKDIVTMASDIRHGYDNTFTQALSHLLEIEKLGHFDRLDLKRVEKELASIQCTLTKEKLDSFSKELQAFSDELEASDYSNGVYKSERMKDDLDYIQQYLILLNSLRDNFVEKLPEIFENSIKVREILKNALGFVTKVKEDTAKESGHGK